MTIVAGPSSQLSNSIPPIESFFPLSLHRTAGIYLILLRNQTAVFAFKEAPKSQFRSFLCHKDDSLDSGLTLARVKRTASCRVCLSFSSFPDGWWRKCSHWCARLEEPRLRSLPDTSFSQPCATQAAHG